MEHFFSQLPVLPVVTPMILAPFALLMRPGRTPWLWATLISWVTFFFCLLLLERVWHYGVQNYNMGDWDVPLGISYRIDLANALIMTLVSGIAAVVFPYALHSVESEIDIRQTPAFYTALVICMTGLLGVAATGDAFNVFVFLEISSLATYALVAMGARNDRRALTAAFSYLVMGTLGATFFVIGLGLLYQATGTLNMADMHDRLDGVDSRSVKAGFAFIVTGLGLKLAMVPVHLWLPNAYTFAPSAVTAFLAASATKVAVYAMMRFVFTVFGSGFDFHNVALDIFIALGIFGMLYASLIAVFRDDVKQLLAYSSVAQIGYMLLGISMGTVGGMSAAFVHLFNHGLMKAALFMAVGCVMLRTGSHQLSAYSGLARRMPWTTWAFVIAGLSLIGVPGTAGFVSKVLLMQAAFDVVPLIPSELIIFFILASSLLAVIYIGRIIFAMVLGPEPENAVRIKEAPAAMLVPLWILVLANLYFGLQSSVLVDVARRAAEQMLQHGLGFGGAF
ncbi:MAG: monovalent cation/H+ antiporter subunit D family protein [Parvularculaceae bacterium]